MSTTNELQVPLIDGTHPESALNTARSEKEVVKPIVYETATVEEIFKSFQKQTELLQKPVTSIDISKPIDIHLTSSGNIISYSFKTLELYNFATQKTIFKEQQSNISYIYSPPQGRYLFIGYLDGKLDKRDPQSFQVVQSVKLESKITSMVSDDKTLYIGLRSGKIVSIPVKDTLESNIKVIKKGDRRHPINLLKLSRDNTFLVAYVDVDSQEQFFVFNLQKDDSKPWYAKLDLSPPPDREDPNKLIHISQNCLNIFARGENNKGITMYSLFDGAVVTNMTKMHTNYIETFLVTNDSNTIVTAGKDKKIKIWDWIKQELIYTLIKHTETVQSLVFSQDEKVLFSAGLDGIVAMWSMLNHQELCMLKTDEPMQIRTIYLTNDNDFLLAQDFDKQTRRLQLWKLEENENGFRINVHLKGVSNCYITPNNEYLVTMVGNKSLTIWNTKSRTQIENHDVSCEFRYHLKALNGTRDSEYIFFQKERGDVIMWSTSTQSEVHVFNHPEQIQDITLTKDDKYMICCAEQDIYRWDIAERKQIATYNKGGGYNLFSCLSFDDKKLYTNGDGANIFVFDVEKGGAPKEFDIINDSGWVLYEISPDQRTLIQTNQYSGSFWVSDLIDKKVLHVLNKHRNKIDLISFSSDGKYLISRSSSETIVWQTKTWKDVITIDQEVGIVTSSSRHLKAFIHDGIYKPWNIQLLRDFSDEIEIEEEDKSERDLRTSIKQTMTQDDVKIRGRYNTIIPLIIAKMVKDNKNEQGSYIDQLKEITITPYNFNIVHYFSYVNQAKCLRSSLQKGAGYIKDQRGNTPIDYAIERKSYECSTILLEYMMQSPTLYQKMSSELLLKLIMFSPSNLKEFFDKSIVEEENDQLPSFGVLISSPMAFHQSQGNILGTNDAKNMINSSENVAGDAEPLQFKTLQLKYNYYTGSQSSMDLHDALEKVETLSAFRSEALQALITYKWNLVKWRAYGSAFIYLLYLINLFALIQDQNYFVASCLLMFDIYFLTFEIIQMRINGLEYFTDFWNMFDFSTLMMLTFFLVNLFSNFSIIDKASQLNLLSLINLFAWFRFLSQLRLFQQTRVLIRLIVEVLKDMIPFFVVLIISVLGFSITYQVLNKDADIVEALQHQYRLMYGDFQPDGYSTTNWILFLIASTLLPLVMLNLLIAIMSDTYARVMADIVPSDFYELNKMILEQEEVMIWNRSKGTPSFLSFGVYIQKAEGDEWEGQIQGILKQLNMSNGTDEASKSKSVQQQDKIYNQLLLQARDTNVKFDEQKKRFDNIQQQVENLKKKIDTQYGIKEDDQAGDEESDGDFFEIASDEEENQDVQIKKFLKRKWEGLDIDSSGKLDKSEAKLFFQDIYRIYDLGTLTTEKFEAAFEKYDTNKDGKIGKKEAFIFFKQLINGE